MKRLMAVLTAMVMMVTMTACVAFTPETPVTGSIVGTWKGEIDYAGVINAFLAADEMFAASGATSNAAPLELTYVFGEDGTVSCTADRESLYAALEAVGKMAAEPMISALSGQTYEEYLAASGMTAEEMMKSIFTDAFVDEIEKVFRFEGTYRLDDKTLAITVAGQTLESVVEMTDSTLKLVSPVGLDLGDAYSQAAKALYPLVLTKA